MLEEHAISRVASSLIGVSEPRRSDRGMHFGKRSSWPAILVILILIASAMACQSHSSSEAVPGTDNSEGSGQHGTQSIEAPPKLYPPGDYSRGLSYGGLGRTYILHVPPSGGDLMPLLIVLHGGGGTGIG